MNSRLRVRVARDLAAAFVVATFWYAVLHLSYTTGGY